MPIMYLPSLYPPGAWGLALDPSLCGCVCDLSQTLLPSAGLGWAALVFWIIADPYSGGSLRFPCLFYIMGL